MADKSICSVDGCGKPHKGKGYCHTHLARFRRHGSPDLPKREKMTCSVEGCDKPYRCSGYCNTHYLRFLRNGDIDLRFNRQAQEYFENVVLNLKGGLEEPCHEWPFFRSENGYGRVVHSGKQGYAHRIACFIVNGDPPSDKHQAAHLCGGGFDGCCHPGHLTWATVSENHAHKHIHGTALIGEKNHWTRLTREKVIEIKGMMDTHTDTQISAKTGVPYSTIWNIRKENSWAWLT
jgi:hypothetical protein